MQFPRFLLLSAAIVVTFDAAASLASAYLQFPYQYAAFGSALIYIALAFLATLKFGFSRAVLLGAALGLVDATAGWAVSWVIGPGRVPSEQFSFGMWALTLLFVVGLGAVCGLAGAAIGGLVRKARAA